MRVISVRRTASVLALLGLWFAGAPSAALPVASGASPEATGPSGPIPAASALPAPTPELTHRIERAWFAPAASLQERVSRTRRASLEVGVWNLDSAARAILNGALSADPLERATAAVRLAPNLPAARMALAEALWLHADSPIGALLAAVRALLAIPSHLEASLWFAGSGLYALAAALVAGGLLCTLAIALWAAPHAAHDLGDLVPGTPPAFARAALLVSVLLLPAALGEGLLGVALSLLVLGGVYGGPRRRGVLALAASLVLLGAFPVARLAGATLSVLPADPVAEAAFSVAHGIPTPVDEARLAAAPEEDGLARRTRARLARARGHLGEADASYQALVDRESGDPVVTNNAANVRLDLGHMESALELYRRAAALNPSASVLFNLSQAYGRGFLMDDLARALAEAQRLDGQTVGEFTQLQGAEVEGFVVDLPLSVPLLRQRLLASPAGESLAAEFREPFAPGLLGRDGRGFALALAVGLFGSELAGRRLRASRWCARCGRRMCPRCDARQSGSELCEGCIRLFQQPDTTDRGLRLARLSALRERGERLELAASLASLVIPGAAGLLAERPLRCLLGMLLFAVTASAVVHRHGVVPDPWLAGSAAPLAFLAVAVLASFAYALVVAMSLAARKNA